MQRDVDRVAEIYAAFGKRNVAAVLELMAPEVEIRQSPELPWGGVYRGVEGVKQFIANLAENLDHRLSVDHLIDAGDHVVAVGRTIGKARKTNLEFDIPFVHVWTVAEGQISAFEPYIDNPTMLTALGQ